MPEIISAYGGFRKTISFRLTCLIYHATCHFCKQNYDYHNDSLGKTVGQMIGAARSARQNIVEGSCRAGTSKECELKLYDVAKASLEELAGDYEAFLTDHDSVPWAANDPLALQLKALSLDSYSSCSDENIRHDFGVYILAMRRKFSSFLESSDPIRASCSILVIIDKICRLLHRQMEALSQIFCEEGGFTERMGKARLAYRDSEDFLSGAPLCPKCGKIMRKIFAKKGRNAGHPFWSCTDYPNCNGTRVFINNADAFSPLPFPPHP